jgi:hypothetical protein
MGDRAKPARSEQEHYSQKSKRTQNIAEYAQNLSIGSRESAPSIGFEPLSFAKIGN